MGAAGAIRQAVTDVSLLRQACARDPQLAAAVADVKRFQARRFAGSYADFLATPEYGPATRFFLDELYNDRDYAQRDAQFARIAGPMEKLFPADVAQSAVALAKLHSLTEQLDWEMALAWLDPEWQDLDLPTRYAHSWHRVGRREDRLSQLSEVLSIGRELARLTAKPGLRFMLKMMRGPASAAGLSSLQHFLEAGFDTFGAMVTRHGSVDSFLGTVQERESHVIELLFEPNVDQSGHALGEILSKASGS